MHISTIKRVTASLLIAASLAAGCSKEPPPRSVTEFVDNPMLLEAAMVRCSRDRAESRYDAECVNAREAVKRIAAEEEADRRAELEARSERKRQALRQTQEAAAEARRRSEEAQRLREEAEYLAQFGVLPPREDGQQGEPAEGNAPVALIPAAEQNQDIAGGEPLPAGDASNAPVAEPGDPAPTDLGEIRDELRRRSESSGDEDSR